MKTDKLKKDFAKVRGIIYAYRNRFRTNGSLNRQEVAILSKCAKQILSWGGYNEYLDAQQVLTDNNARLQ